MEPPRFPRTLAASDFWWALALLAALALALRLADVLLLVFAALLLALVLLRLAAPLERRGLHRLLALTLAVLGSAAVLVAVFWSAGAAAQEQLQTLRDTLPRALQALRTWLEGRAGGRLLIEAWNAAELSAQDWLQVAGLATFTVNAMLGAAGALVLVIVLGLYLAADAEGYRGGLLRLVPARQRARAGAALQAARHDLDGWLLGQAVSMLAVGLATAIGLWAVGMPLVLGLSVIAGLLEFVPYFGPVITGVLVVAIGFTEGEAMAGQAFAVCLVVQQAEGYLVQPLAQRWAVRMPPVLGLVAVLVFGLLFGVPGVLLAVPLMVLVRALVRVLYVEGLLGGAGTRIV